MGVWAMMELPRLVRLASYLVCEQKPVLIGEEEAGRHGVDADVRRVLLGHVHGEPLGEVAHGGLGSGVSGDAGEGPEGVHRGDVEDGSVPLPRP